MRVFRFTIVLAGLTVIACDCVASDAALFHDRAMICNSLTQSYTPWCEDYFLNASASGDWPNQAVYMRTLLARLASPATCLNTSYAADTVAWLNTTLVSPSIGGNFWNTWLVFQVQYYDMPRKAGVRIESPDTLGRKCWAMDYLKLQWAALAAPLQQRIAAASLNIEGVTAMFTKAVPLTFGLCQDVICNCFENATYDPSRSGSCKIKVTEFHYTGFDREEVKGDRPSMDYPWHEHC